MDNNKSAIFPPLSSSSPYATTITNSNIKSESSSSPVQATTLDFASFSHDVDKMLDNPPRNGGHWHAQSETLTLLGDISFDNDLDAIEATGGPSFVEDTEEDLSSIYLNMDKFNSSYDNSVPTSTVDNIVTSTNRRLEVSHQRSQSMDGSIALKSKMSDFVSNDVSTANYKKPMPAAKLSEFAFINPKRAKRILARQSIAKSKKRKTDYISKLRKRLHTLQIEVTSLSTRSTILKGYQHTLSTEKNELELELQIVKQRVHLENALSDVLKEEIQHLKVLKAQQILQIQQSLRIRVHSPSIVVSALRNDNM